MTRDRMLATVQRLAVAKRAHDIDALLALYSEDCVLEQPSLGVRRVGHAALGPVLRHFAQVFPDYERSFEGAAVDGDTLVSWGMARMTLTGTFRGEVPNGRRAAVMTFVLFRFDAHQKIVFEGHHWDLGSLCTQSGVSLQAMSPPDAPISHAPEHSA